MAPDEDLPPEPQDGGIEYKLKLVNISDSRITHLITQMKWRLAEGQGEAIYELGVEDCGRLTGMTRTELDSTLSTLNRMAKELKADTTVLRERRVSDDRVAVEVLVRKTPDDFQFPEIAVAVVGNVDAGKSTLLGTLVTGRLDNGRGKTRLHVFRHKHEVETGRTSSICRELLGFDSKGGVVNYDAEGNIATWEDVMGSAAKIISFIDLAGHEKYLGTTVLGLTDQYSSVVLLVIAANVGVSTMTREHLGLALALNLPLVAVISKIDMASSTQLRRTIEQISTLLKMPGCKRVPLLVESDDDVIMASASMASDKVAPIFCVSSVSGTGLDHLRKFLNLIPITSSFARHGPEDEELLEYRIGEIYTVPDVGTVVGGMVVSGVLRVHDTVLIGPDGDGQFKSVRIKSIRRYRTPYRVVSAGQSATLAFEEDVDRDIVRRGAVVVLVYMNGICQTAQIVHVDSDSGSMRPGEHVRVRFRFLHAPEYLNVGSDVLLRVQRTKALGKVISVTACSSPSKA